MHWKSSKKKGHMQTSSPHKLLKTANITRCLQQDLAITERTSTGGTPKQMQACNPSPLKKQDLIAEQIEGREIEIATTKDNQLHLLIDTPTAKIYREPSDPANQLSLALRRHRIGCCRGRKRPERPPRR